jgi:hypothetical protein
VAKEKPDRRLTGEPGGFLAIRGDAIDVDVGDEVVGVGAAKDEHLHRRVGFGLLDQRHEVAHQLGTEQVHRRCEDRREDDGAVAMDAQRLERVGLGHRRCDHQPAPVAGLREVVAVRGVAMAISRRKRAGMRGPRPRASRSLDPRSARAIAHRYGSEVGRRCYPIDVAAAQPLVLRKERLAIRPTSGRPWAKRSDPPRRGAPR